jgi:hypothetical protein
MNTQTHTTLSHLDTRYSTLVVNALTRRRLKRTHMNSAAAIYNSHLSPNAEETTRYPSTATDASHRLSLRSLI